MSDLSFETFFEEVHGHAPFPWQSALARRVVKEGRWPDLLDLPTGVGKTTAIDVALFALAVDPERSPRRIVLVVDRRIIVDQAADHAQVILTAFEEGRGSAVAERLRALWAAPPDSPPFTKAVLRGGVPRQADWARRPDQPVVALSTVDQAGSRLLFRGYGVSDSMAPIHAGLFGQDTLFLLDEVHLSEPFRQTLVAVRDRWASNVGVHRFQVVQMSATAGAAADRVHRLSDEDRAHEVLRQRLRASKPTRLETVTVSGMDESDKRATLAAAAAEQALRLVTKGARTVGVVVNRVDTARRVCTSLAGRDDLDAVLLTGRMRPLDRDRLLASDGPVWPRVRAGRSRRADQRPLILVATQTVEAGADLDFDALVTECASFDALRQRFGRLDRRGEVESCEALPLKHAEGVILVRSDQALESNGDPVYGAALAATAQYLASLGDGLDFGLASLRIPDDLSGLVAARADAPVLMPVHVRSWAQTAPVPEPDPEVALWLHGTEATAPEINLVWRSEVDVLASESGGIDWRVLSRGLAACPPRIGELLPVPLAAARAWLTSQDEAEVSDTLGTRALEGTRATEASSPRFPWFLWTGEEVIQASERDLRPGQTVVVGCSAGGLTGDNWDPSSGDPVSDLGDLAQLDPRLLEALRARPNDTPQLDRMRGRPTLRLWPAALVGLDARGFWGSGPAFPEEEDEEIESVVAEWLSERAQDAAEDPVSRFLARHLSSGTQARPSFTVLFAERGLITLEVRDLAGGEVVSEGEDASFLGTRSVGLARHGEDVRSWAERFARNLALPEGLKRDIVLAAYLHDIGKADPRFQMWLSGGSEVRLALQQEPLAKSSLTARDRARRDAARIRSGYPRGERHELLSAFMLERAPEALAEAADRELVLHLVASHHGYCRPFAPAIDDETDLPVAFEQGGWRFEATTRHGGARLDSPVAHRFWKLNERYGPWGLAWLEALVRLADHRASEEEDQL